MSIVYCDGEMVPAEEAKIPFTDRGFQCGDGAYATIQVNDGIPLFLNTHLKRLREQCALFYIQMPDLKSEVMGQLIDLNQAHSGIWRMKIFITGGDSELMRLPDRSGRVIIYLKPFTPLPFKRLHMALFSIPYFSCHASFKSLAHLNRYYVMEEAYRLGVDDAVTTTESGILLEAAFGNLFWAQEKKLYTPEPTLPLYSGVTLNNTLNMAQQLGFNLQYVRWRLTEIPEGCCAYRTNTMQGIRPIERIGERSFADHPTLQTLLLTGYEDLVRKEKKAAVLDKWPDTTVRTIQR